MQSCDNGHLWLRLRNARVYTVVLKAVIIMSYNYKNNLKRIVYICTYTKR